MSCAGCTCHDECDYSHQLDWDTKVELLEIELEAIRKELEELGRKFDKIQEGLRYEEF
jgi:chaperonin cofactor prefoldin